MLCNVIFKKLMQILFVILKKAKMWEIEKFTLIYVTHKLTFIKKHEKFQSSL